MIIIFIFGNSILSLFAILCILYTMNKMLIPLFALLVISIPITYADEDEFEDDDNVGFGIMEQERERELDHEDDDGLAIGSGTGDLILYVTIAAIIASVGYTGFKIFNARKPKIKA